MKIELRADICQFDVTGRSADGEAIAIRIWGQDKLRNEFEILVAREDFLKALTRMKSIYREI